MGRRDDNVTDGDSIFCFSSYIQIYYRTRTPLPRTLDRDAIRQGGSFCVALLYQTTVFDLDQFDAMSSMAYCAKFE